MVEYRNALGKFIPKISNSIVSMVIGSKKVLCEQMDTWLLYERNQRNGHLKLKNKFNDWLMEVVIGSVS